jgi:hypothetical protein
MKTLKDFSAEIQSKAAALYDGGWRAADRELIQEEYKLTETEADEMADALAIIETTCPKCGGHMERAEYLDGESSFNSCLTCMDCGEFYREIKEDK